MNLFKVRQTLYYIQLLSLKGNDVRNFILTPFVLTVPIVTNPCIPSPCGPNSQCREINGQAVCSCVLGYLGSPPLCRPECVVSSDCPLNRACSNQKCIDPCVGSCGVAAKCNVVKHNPICTCPAKYTGDPFTRCIPYSKYFY